MQTIKITSSAKGEHHWEQYLLKKQEIRLQKLLNRLEVNPFAKRKVIKLFKHKVGFDNIIALCNHPIDIFLSHLISDTLDELLHCTTLKTKQHEDN